MAFAAIAAAATAAYLVFIVLAHVQGRHYSVITNAVSDYAVGVTSRWFTGMGICTALGAGALLPVVGAQHGFSRRMAVVVMLGILALGRLVLLLFKTDVHGEETTATGRIHLLIAVVNFTLMYVVIDTVSSRLGELSITGGWASALDVLRWVTLVGLVGVVVTMIKPFKRFFGLVERVFLVAANGWFLVFALVFATR